MLGTAAIGTSPEAEAGEQRPLGARGEGPVGGNSEPLAPRPEALKAFTAGGLELADPLVVGAAQALLGIAVVSLEVLDRHAGTFGDRVGGGRLDAALHGHLHGGSSQGRAGAAAESHARPSLH
jgi:hypothetical protein